MNIQQIKNMSAKAICGTFERQIVVDAEDVSDVKRTLRDKGFIIVGQGDFGMGKKVVWYNPSGMNL